MGTMQTQLASLENTLADQLDETGPLITNNANKADARMATIEQSLGSLKSTLDQVLAHLKPAAAAPTSTAAASATTVPTTSKIDIPDDSDSADE